MSGSSSQSSAGFDHDSVQMLAADQILEWESGSKIWLFLPFALSPSRHLESEKAVCTQP
jgi:hypothetical protein